MKNIVVFIDGTGQDMSTQEKAERTNVARLYDGCKSIPGQAVRYCNGVGTDLYEGFTGNAFGKGLEKRVIEAYKFLQQEVGAARNNREDFKIFLFGFSRGAFAVRWLASVIAYSGIPKWGESERLGVYNMWNNNSKDANRLKDEGRYYDVPIEMIGVWDTVQATKTKDFGIKDIPCNVAAAYHAMALDEYRAKFKVTRFNPSIKVTEVWFAGCHADVGGGYEDGLVTANISLSWMIKMAEKHGLQVKRDNITNYEEDCYNKKPVIHDEMKPENEGNPSQKEAGSHWLAKLWKVTNWFSGVDKYVRLVLPTDSVHSSVGLWATEYDIAHLQNTQNCNVWASGGRDMIA